MNLSMLEEYLHEHIPLSKAIDVKVVKADSHGVTLSAPLAPNINHRETVFGGSASAVAILAAWTLLHVRLKQEGISRRVVIQRNTMNYERPIVDTFMATSSLHDPMRWEKFIRTLKRKNKARITVFVTLQCVGETVGKFEGDFVALSADSA